MIEAILLFFVLLAVGVGAFALVGWVIDNAFFVVFFVVLAVLAKLHGG